MDYKYIEQLLERYWSCETSLEEEEILKAFFSQKELPASLRRYRDLFAYEHQEVKDDVLGDDFDARMMEMVSEKKARTISLTQRLMPLFKAAAVVAIFLTLGNAAQRAFEAPEEDISDMAVIEQPTTEGKSVAMGDSLKVDTTLQQAAQQPEPVIIK